MRKFEVWVLDNIADEFDKLYIHFYPTRAEALRAFITEKIAQMKKELEKRPS